jgi:hypothetical protein
LRTDGSKHWLPGVGFTQVSATNSCEVVQLSSSVYISEFVAFSFTKGGGVYSTMFALSNHRFYVYGDSRKNSKQRAQTSWTFDNNSGLNGLFGSESDGSSEALYPI